MHGNSHDKIKSNHCNFVTVIVIWLIFIVNLNDKLGCAWDNNFCQWQPYKQANSCQKSYKGDPSDKGVVDLFFFNFSPCSTWAKIGSAHSILWVTLQCALLPAYKLQYPGFRQQSKFAIKSVANKALTFNVEGVFKVLHLRLLVSWPLPLPDCPMHQDLFCWGPLNSSV